MTVERSGSSKSQQLAEYWSNCRLADLPSDVKEQAKSHLIDTIAAAIVGSATPPAELGRRAFAAMNGKGGGNAALWATPVRLPAGQAALLNGLAAHALELDDFGGCGHSGAVVVPAVLAALQAAGGTGEDLLVAVVAGYDVAARTLSAAGGYNAHNELGWHSTGTCGSFGAAMGAARALRLDCSSMSNALGTAGTFTGGTWAFNREGAMTKRYHPGRAAENGVTAAFLAQAGFTGPTRIYEEEWGGFLSTYCRDEPGEDLCADLGRTFHLKFSGIKAYACCRGIHSALDALTGIMSAGKLASRDIKSINVELKPQNARMVGGRKVENTLEAQMSLAYSVSVAAVRGQVLVKEFDPLMHSDPEVKRLMDSVAISPTLPSEFPEDGAILSVELVDGSNHSRSVAWAVGGPQYPIGPEGIRAKARSLIDGHWTETAAEHLFDIVDDLEDASDLAPLWSWLCGPHLQA